MARERAAPSVTPADGRRTGRTSAASSGWPTNGPHRRGLQRPVLPIRIIPRPESPVADGGGTAWLWQRGGEIHQRATATTLGGGPRAGGLGGAEGGGGAAEGLARPGGIRAGRQDPFELAAGADTELGEHVAEVVLGGAGA